MYWVNMFNFMGRPKKIKEEVKVEEEVVIVPEVVEEVEMYNGKKVISKGEVEINGVKHKTITTEEGSTYTI